MRLGPRRIIRTWTDPLLHYGQIFGSGEEVFSELIPITIRHLRRGESSVLYGPVNIVRCESDPIRKIVETLAWLMNYRGPAQYVAE
jgi:hypothetical protein